MRLYQIKRFYRLYGSCEVLKTYLWKLKISFLNRNPEEALTIIITSAGRKDYLKKTIDSLSLNLRYEGKIYWHIIDDNPESTETRSYISSKYFDKVIFNKKNLGLGLSLNKIYRTIRTKYILHCEDDWLFLEPVNVTELINVLKRENEQIQLILNRKERYKLPPLVEHGKAYITRYYSFNPHLISFDLIPEILPFSRENTERTISDQMRRKNVKSIVYGFKKNNFVSHLGKVSLVTKY